MYQKWPYLVTHMKKLRRKFSVEFSLAYILPAILVIVYIYNTGDYFFGVALYLIFVLIVKVLHMRDEIKTLKRKIEDLLKITKNLN